MDGLNTHDDGFRHSLSGGVTTSLILPGSVNAIGTFSYLAIPYDTHSMVWLLQVAKDLLSNYDLHSTDLHIPFSLNLLMVSTVLR